MDPITFAITCFAAIILVIFLGVPVAFAIFSVTVIGMSLTVGNAFVFAMVKSIVYSATANYSFAVVPMFILMGEIAGVSRIISDLYTACYRWIGGYRGGVYNATVLASAGFAAISGSTVVNAAVFTRVALPELIRLGLNRGFGAGCIAASGTLAAMIPPSLTMVLYGILTQESIGALLVAGILPGMLTAGMLIITVYLSSLFRTDLRPQNFESFTLREKIVGLRDVWPAAALGLIIMIGLYTGAVAPSAAGTIGVAGSLLISVLKRRISFSQFVKAVKRSVVIAASLFFIIVAGLLFSRLLLVSGSVSSLTVFINDTGFDVWRFLALIIIAYLILGMFIDPVSLMVITLPFIYPTAKSLGIDPIWLGILIVKLLEIGAITPPIGINLFAVISASDGELSTREVFSGVLPFIGAEVITLSLLVAFPAISTYLPSTMGH